MQNSDVRSEFFGGWGVAKKLNRLPCYNGLEIHELPVDFFDVVQFRMYLDSVEETLAFYEHIDEPHDYVKYTPALFNRWLVWAKAYKTVDQDFLRPFGTKIGPDWMRSEFEGIDSFYRHYLDITENL